MFGEELAKLKQTRRRRPSGQAVVTTQRLTTPRQNPRQNKPRQTSGRERTGTTSQA